MTSTESTVDFLCSDEHGKLIVYIEHIEEDIRTKNQEQRFEKVNN